MGHPSAFERPEDRDLLTGAAHFVADLNQPPVAGAAHAVFVRSPFAHALIQGVGASAAEQMPGVLRVVIGSGITLSPYGTESPSRFQQPLLARDRVRFVGEAVAVVLAETLAAAVDAAEMVDVEYEPLAAVLSVSDATEIMVDVADRGIATAVIDSVVNRSKTVVTYEMDNPRQSAVPMETRGAVAVWHDARLLVWDSTQRPHQMKDLLMTCYGLSADEVRVVAGPNVGGGFGGKGMPAVETLLLPDLARLVERPVRWTESRSDYLQSAPQGRGESVRVQLGGTYEGQFEAIRVEIVKDGGAYKGSGADLPASYSYPSISTVYDIPIAEFDTRTKVTNKPVLGALRGAGRAPMIAAVERAVDEYAAVIGIDPAELRRRNLISPDAMPFTSATGGRFDDSDYPASLAAVLEASDYAGLRLAQAERRRRNDVRQLGIGLASFNHRTNGAGSEKAIVQIHADGSATVTTGSTSQGHGHTVTWALLVEQDLGIPAASVRVVEGDTDLVDTGVGAIGSRSVQTAGLAVHSANELLVNLGLDVAAELLEAASVDMRFEPRIGFHATGTPARAVSWSEVAVATELRGKEASCDATSDPSALDVYPSGCHLAVVEVDVQTGRWTIEKYAAADDVGTRISPTLVEGQLHGGISMGAGQVLGEEVIYDDDGNPLTSTFMDYQIPTIDQFCQFELHPTDVPSSFNDRGYKAVGESGPIGATPAIHNAVVDAVRHLGVTDIPIPCTPQRVWRAIPR